ncbi:hypothetical protein SAMN05421730_102322 [Anaerobium acetethylicum]|uniref:Uncharacterized protein n=1 Tax=Anaerobium acetethylicum TaxID=1619234 RepID=A0A1D3TWI8_9FIRM|nr:hypothetical protein SAMN05421730_102322 [Anaerobium acetethylicum]
MDAVTYQNIFLYRQITCSLKSRKRKADIRADAIADLKIE